MFWRKKERTFVLGLDGVPYSFIKKLADDGVMSNFGKLRAAGKFKEINSVYPTISSVAWSSYMTGQNPAQHGIFGFIDRQASPLKLFIPTANNLQSKTLWEKLSEQGKRVIVMNVPLTYPPRPVNGILISGFLCPDINKVSYPSSLAELLKEREYIIDADPWLGRKSKDEFLKQLNRALERRFDTMFYLMHKEKWDFFQCHIMETDRINHFYWQDMQEPGNAYYQAFFDFYGKIDDNIGKLVDTSDSRDRLVILSDHGFCTLKTEVQLNYWLMQEGYLKLAGEAAKSIEAMSADSLAYSLIPGRIYVNLVGREERGSVKPEDYESLRRELKEKLLELTEPESGHRIIKEVLHREEVYSGPLLSGAADLIAIPYDGYDLKAAVDKQQLTGKEAIQGMHTFDNAFLYTNKEQEDWEQISSIESASRLVL